MTCRSVVLFVLILLSSIASGQVNEFPLLGFPKANYGFLNEHDDSYYFSSLYETNKNNNGFVRTTALLIGHKSSKTSYNLLASYKLGGDTTNYDSSIYYNGRFVWWNNSIA